MVMITASPWAGVSGESYLFLGVAGRVDGSVSRGVGDVWAVAVQASQLLHYCDRSSSDLLAFYSEWAFTAAVDVALPK